jgi:cold shock CspA family protein
MRPINRHVFVDAAGAIVQHRDADWRRGIDWREEREKERQRGAWRERNAWPTPPAPKPKAAPPPEPPPPRGTPLPPLVEGEWLTGTVMNWYHRGHGFALPDGRGRNNGVFFHASVLGDTLPEMSVVDGLRVRFTVRTARAGVHAGKLQVEEMEVE